MNKLLILGTSFAVLLSAGVVMAEDKKSADTNDTVMFQTLRSGPSDLTPMTDEALEATEGKGNLCVAGCSAFLSQIARMTQGNTSVLSLGAVQTNAGAIVQSNIN